MLNLLERGAEVAQIRAVIDRSRQGLGGLLLVEGPPGVGKSSLLHDAIQYALGLKMRVASASGGALESEFSFGVAHDLFMPTVANLSVAARGRAFSGAAAAARALFDPAAGTDDAAPTTTSALVHSLYWLLAGLTPAGRGLLVVVDDAHDVDVASLRWLAYLSRRLADLPVCVLMARRPKYGVPAIEPDIRLGIFAQIANEASSLVIRPALLSPAAVALLAERYMETKADPEFLSACQQVTGGNPFLVHALMSELVAEGIPPSRREASRIARTTPDAVLHAVVARMSQLPAVARDLVRAVLVLGDGVSVARAAALAGTDSLVAQDTAHQLVGAGIIADGPTLAFAHPLVRSAIGNEISPLQVADAHLDAAELLRSHGAPPDVVAAHLLAAQTGSGYVWILDVLRTAAALAARRGEPDRAAALLRRAVAEGPGGEELGVILSELGRAQAKAADPVAATTLADALLHLKNPVARLVAFRALGDTLLARGERENAVEVYRRGLLECGGDQRATRELKAVRAVALAMSPTGIGEALELATSIPPDGRETPNERALLAHIAVGMGFKAGRREEIRATAWRAWSDGQLLADEGPDGHLWSLLTATLTWNDCHKMAIDILGVVMHESRRHGSPLAYATASYCRAAVNLMRGSVAEAAVDVRLALDARADGWATYVSAAQAVLARCYIELGDFAAAEAELPDPDSAELSASMEGLYVLTARARLYLATGRAEQALVDYLTLGQRGEHQFGLSIPALFPWHSGAARACLQLGDSARARKLIDEGLAVALGTGVPTNISQIQCANGLLTGGERGLQLLSEAVHITETCEPTLQRMYALIEYGAALRRANQRTQARVQLTLAYELAVSVGASAIAARADEEMRAAGGSSHRHAISGIVALTASEQRVAKLAASGYTNREIAQALFVTVKTVELHLKNTYRKLGVSSRRQLAHAFPAGEITGPSTSPF